MELTANIAEFLICFTAICAVIVAMGLMEWVYLALTGGNHADR